MRAMIAIALLLIVGQANADEQPISVQHDSTRAVTCWITPQGGISCLPDSSLLRGATSTHEAGRASQASSAYESDAVQAAPLPQKKGFKL